MYNQFGRLSKFTILIKFVRKLLNKKVRIKVQTQFVKNFITIIQLKTLKRYNFKLHLIQIHALLSQILTDLNTFHEPLLYSIQTFKKYLLKST